MSARILAAVVLSLVFLAPAVSHARDAEKAQSAACEDVRAYTNHARADRAALNAGVICLTVNTAFSPAPPPSQRRLLAMLLLLSAQRAQSTGAGSP